VQSFGGPEELTVDRRPFAMPRPGRGELVVEVEAAGVNYFDVYQRQGMGNMPLPFTPGLEGVGRIVDVGDDVGTLGLTVGQRVAWINVLGSYATHVIVAAHKAVRVPDELATSEALLFQSVTAQYLVSEYRAIRSGDRVLVHSAAGGVGQLLVQWFKHLGAWVVGTTSSDGKVGVVRDAGADEVINYGHDYTFVDEVLALTDGSGVDLAIDGIGSATLAQTLKSLAFGGTAVSIGSASGAAPAIAAGDLNKRCLRLAGGSVFSYTQAPGELQRRAAAVMDGIREGWLRVGEGRSYPLFNAADAHRDLEGRKTQGKLYLYPAASHA
jgi:NADPH2:quinone reductase